LVDRHYLDKIVEASEITSRTDVIEIGPGLGALTEKLLAKARRVLAYEIDAELIPILRQNLPDSSRFLLLHQDVLGAEIDRDIETFLPESDEVVMVANLPYYITTPILMRFLETSHRVQKIVIMVQAEVANRITSTPDSKEYNALSVAINYRARTRILFGVPRTVFMPRPNVDSAVVELRIGEPSYEKPKDEGEFFALVHRCFAQRRKTLINNLRQANPTWSRGNIEDLLRNCGLDLNIRAEALDIPDFIRLADAISRKD
jgi:16S rRNA (adenine1518-N6/adenine1519-N6)-dimethyltransferase